MMGWAPKINFEVLMATARGDWSEVDALMPTRSEAPTAAGDSIDELLADIAGATGRQRRSAIALEALVPGAGKTYLAKLWLERTGQKATALILCPWNALVTQLVKEGFRAITLHELCGRLAVETEDGRELKKAYSLDGVTHIHFEEAYLYPVHQVGWMADFTSRKTGYIFRGLADISQRLYRS